ncbi:amino acid adenylation domain-containing protein [Legionella dresdenensis]|uniref:Amino acid adenylation domain-containing protein n=1 Tax=Legionella dresdenensis TaxID=450200 RepID=A0ABV8CC12_9GAMM
MQNFNISIQTNDPKFIPILFNVNALGHRVTICTQSEEIINFCSNELIDFVNKTNSEPYDIIIASTASKDLFNQNTYVITPSLSAGDFDSPIVPGACVYWTLYKPDNEAQTFGHYIAKEICETDEIIHSLQESMIELIVNWSRNESLPPLQQCTAVTDIKTTYTFELNANLHDALTTLMHRYFDTDTCLMRAKHALNWAHLDGTYDVKKPASKDFEEPNLFIIHANTNTITEKIEKPDALLFLKITASGPEFNLYSNDIRFKNLLEHMAAIINTNDPTIDILSTDEQQKIRSFNRPKVDLPQISIIEQFERIRLQFPDQIAIVFKDEQWTYKELDNLSDRISFYLNSLKLSIDSPLLIAMDRHPLTIATILGVLKANCCYVPIDPSYPAERVVAMARDTNALYCLSTTSDINHFKIDKTQAKIIYIDEILVAKYAYQLNTKQTYPKASDLAYIIYTSGSTGTPKGVMIEHRNVINLVFAETEVCQISVSSRILNIASLGFDAAGWDIYGALLNGGTLYIAPKEIHTSPDELHQFIKNEQISLATLTPAVLALMPREAIDSLKTLVVMGDVCPRDVMEFWGSSVRLFNGYGPTEATIGATMSEFKPDKNSTCIGKPMLNYEAYVLDEHLNMQPLGIKGELYIAGYGLSRGYFNNPELTRERFIYHKFKGDLAPTRLYKTGDLACWNNNGSLEFIGRKDYQVKIRGIRLELGEVEIVLEKKPEVQQALVITGGEDGNKHLIAYVTLHDNMQTTKRHLLDYLKHYFHPSVLPQSIMILDAFPINANGKIDRKNLPTPIYDVFERQEVEEPSTFQEKAILAIIQSLLQKRAISIKQNIFEIGVHSLIAAQIAARINEQFKIKCSTRDVFEKPTVYDLALMVRSRSKTDDEWTIPIVYKRKGPLTPSQKRLWFLHELNPANTSYNLPFAIELNGPLQIDLFNQAFDTMVQKHESFRLIFNQEHGIPYQEALAHFSYEIPIILVNSSELDATLTQYCQLTFSLKDKPPFFAALFKLEEQKHVFFMVKHNIITDAWSEGIIISELARTYEKLLNNEAVVKHQQSPQIIDAAFVIHEYLNSKSMDESFTYWTKKLEHAKCFDFPTDKARPIHLKGLGYRYRHAFTKINLEKLRRLAQSNLATPFMLLVSALNVFMAKYSGQTDIILGTALAGRDISDLEQMTGFFVNTLPLRTCFSDNDTFTEILKLTRLTCIEAYEHQNLPFESIVEATRAERTINKNPLFQIMVVLQNADESQIPSFGPIKTKRRLVQTHTSMFDLVWNFSEDSELLTLELDYSTELFEAKSIERQVTNFENLLAYILEYEDTVFKQLPIVSEYEQQVISQFEHGSKYQLPSLSIVEQITKQAELTPEYIALRVGDNVYTYRSLLNHVDLLARGIQSKIRDSNHHIGILMDRNEHMVFAILATLKTGNVYVPIDPDYPNERVQLMLEDSKVSMVITEKSPFSFKKVPYFSTQDLLDAGANQVFKPVAIGPENLAYILYTSGSTGHPKGVMVTQQNLANLCIDFVNRLSFDKSDRFLSITTISFDIFGLELYCPLIAGIELVICNQDIARNPVYLVNYINEIQPSHMQATPTMWSMIADHIAIKNTFTVLCGGEAMSSSLLSRLQQRATKIFNVYGPTETTIWSTAAELSSEKTIHIGKPISNTNCYVLDDAKNKLPIGVWGDLYIGGAGVAKGYWNREELTQSVFVIVNNEQVYKTGDKAKWDADGNLVYGGRADSQIKLRGHRIELGEIEAAIMSCISAEQVVVAVQPIQNDKVLVAYLVFKAQKPMSLSVDELRVRLEDKLPSYMIPSALVELAAIPLTPNKKVDRKKLPIPDRENASSDARYVPPATSFEAELQTIWQNVMKMNNLSVVESFFSLGGHSLHIPQIVSNINSLHNTSLTVRDFILHSTIRDLAAYLNTYITNQEDLK